MSLESVRNWIVAEGALAPDAAAFVRGLALVLTDEGTPIHRSWYGTRTLHPQVWARGYSWTRSGDAVATHTVPHGVEGSERFKRLTVGYCVTERIPFRRRLGAGAVLDYEPLPELSAAGATDYYMVPIAFGAEMAGAMSWTTDRPTGFTDAELSRFDALVPHIALVARLFAQADIAATLLRTYLGADAGGRVQSGQVRLGDGESLRAALWFCDMRGFTTLSERLPVDALLGRLNRWFDGIVGPVEDRGGEVLKFTGDGLLAIFPERSDAASACRAALSAADDARARIDVPWGLALHFGDVIYGNIGSGQRLDFTVIGTAVNRAARIEGLCGPLGEPVLASGEFVTLAGVESRSLGFHPLKGVPEPVEVFAPGQ